MPAHRSAYKSDSGTRELFSGECGEYNLDLWVRKQGYVVIAGVDEVGRGPLAGPVVAAAVVLPQQHRIKGLADSKTLSASERMRLSGEIIKCATAYGIGQIESDRIDCVNILTASLDAMSLAFMKVLAAGVVPDVVLVDGKFPFPSPPGARNILQKTFVKADARSPTVSAASIVAKVYRDELMNDYHQRFPRYGFDQHKGYATAEHRRALAEYGPCEIHRRSFFGVCEEDEELDLFTSP